MLVWRRRFVIVTRLGFLIKRVTCKPRHELPRCFCECRSTQALSLGILNNTMNLAHFLHIFHALDQKQTCAQEISRSSGKDKDPTSQEPNKDQDQSFPVILSFLPHPHLPPQSTAPPATDRCQRSQGTRPNEERKRPRGVFCRLRLVFDSS